MYIGNVDLITRRLCAVYFEIQVGLAQNPKDSQIFNSFDLAHNGDNLIGLLLENVQVIAVDFCGQFALYPTDRLFHVVFYWLRKNPDDTGNFVQFATHGGDQFVLVLTKDRPPLLLRLEVNKVFGIEKTRRIRSVIRAPDLAGALEHLGKGTKHGARLVCHPDSFAWSRAGSKRASHS